MNFKTWIDEKKVKDRDLVFACALKDPFHLKLFEKVSEQMASLSPSFTEGLGFLEQVTDLILMGYQEDLFVDSQSFDTWKQSIHKKRYPQSSQRDEVLKSKFENLPWPYGSKIKFERRGDRSGIELKMFISTPTDLTKILASLERVKQELES